MITVLGASGFIGSHLVEHLQRSGIEFQAPGRDEPLAGRDLGHVIYCIGLTADFRDRPFDAVDAHVCNLLEVVRNTTFESFLYLSSTRLYIRNSGVAREDDVLHFNPLQFEDIYNLSKATGESVVLSLGAKGRVVRLSNVYGAGQAGTFLSMILSEASTRGAITLQTALESERDYISVRDVVALLVMVALHGRERIYNLASGENVTNAEVTEAIARLTGCTVSVVPDAPAAIFPRIDNARIRAELGFTPARFLDELPSLIGGMPPPASNAARHDAAIFAKAAGAWLEAGLRAKYPYTFTWLGRPIIQFPDDLLRLQEVIYRVQPDVIIETGVAHGGSLIFHAGLCKLLGRGRVIGVDIEIRPHNRAAIEAHPLKPLITLVEGSSTDAGVVRGVKELVAAEETALIVLDSSHASEHVLAELEAYAPLVRPGSYIIAMDGHLMELAAGSSSGAAGWRTNNPNTAVRQFVRDHPEFVVEELPLLFNESALTHSVTGFQGGVLKRIR